jgi:peptidyl-prolyl cis-trans isomerase B (cyclophilin B)
MAQGRSPKRARQKERRNMRRDEWRAYVQRRRRQRWGVFLGSLAVIGIGVVVALFAFKGDGDKPSASASAGPTPPAGAASVEVPIKEPVACDADLPDAAGSKKKTDYASAEDQGLDPDKTYIWHLETSCGDVDIELDLEHSPKTANSIAFLTREKFYDGTFFHRLVQNFVAQGGDPKGDGTGGSGYQVVEPPPEDIKYSKGVVAMAKGGADPAGASGSQFFISVSDRTAETLASPDYALLGEVVEGLDVVDDIIKNGHVADGVPPKEWVYIERATIVEQ